MARTPKTHGTAQDDAKKTGNRPCAAAGRRLRKPKAHAADPLHLAEIEVTMGRQGGGGHVPTHPPPHTRARPPTRTHPHTQGSRTCRAAARSMHLLYHRSHALPMAFFPPRSPPQSAVSQRVQCLLFVRPAPPLIWYCHRARRLIHQPPSHHRPRHLPFTPWRLGGFFKSA